MPNWVENTLTITGDKEQIQKVKEQLNAPYERTHPKFNGKEDVVETTKYSNPIFSFWNIIAPPADKLEEYEGVHGYSDGEKKGDTPFNWYVFNNREWGTKWDVAVADGSKYAETQLYKDEETTLMYVFNTAWSPPTPAIEKLSSQYPELEITLRWEEEQGYGAEEIYQDGSYSTIEEWDIPNSHKDYVDRDNEDGCVCAYSEDPDDYYDDCPDAKKVIELTCVKDVQVVKSGSK
jgi:hypothetical protein